MVGWLREPETGADRRATERSLGLDHELPEEMGGPLPVPAREEGLDVDRFLREADSYMLTFD